MRRHQTLWKSFFPFSDRQRSTLTWRAHASSLCPSSCLLPGSLRRWMGDGAGFRRWKVTGLEVRRRGLPISVCRRSVHRGWWPAFEKSPSRPEPSPSPGRTETPGAPSESQTSAIAATNRQSSKENISTHFHRNVGVCKHQIIANILILILLLLLSTTTLYDSERRWNCSRQSCN